MHEAQCVGCLLPIQTGGSGKQSWVLGHLALHQRQAALLVIGQMVNISSFAPWTISDAATVPQKQPRPTHRWRAQYVPIKLYSQSRLWADGAPGPSFAAPCLSVRKVDCVWHHWWGLMVKGAPANTYTVILEVTDSVYDLFPSLPALLFLHHVPGPGLGPHRQAPLRVMSLSPWLWEADGLLSAPPHSHTLRVVGGPSQWQNTGAGASIVFCFSRHWEGTSWILECSWFSHGGMSTRAFPHCHAFHFNQGLINRNYTECTAQVKGKKASVTINMFYLALSSIFPP